MKSTYFYMSFHNIDADIHIVAFGDVVLEIVRHYYMELQIQKK